MLVENEAFAARRARRKVVPRVKSRPFRNTFLYCREDGIFLFNFMRRGIIVIKIGSNVIFGNSARVDLAVLENIAREVSALRAAGAAFLAGADGFDFAAVFLDFATALAMAQDNPKEGWELRALHHFDGFRASRETRFEARTSAI